VTAAELDRERMAAGGALVAELLRTGAPALRRASDVLGALGDDPGDGAALEAVGERLAALAAFLEGAEEAAG
jgi:hypothetical protein